MTVVNTAPPVVSGTLRQGQVLTTTNGTWTYDLDVLSYAYRWLRCDSSAANCVAIPGATSSSYTLTAADVGSRIESEVAATESATPPPPPPMGNLPAVISAGGTYSGSITVNQSGPAVRITTSQPVVIENAAITNTGDGAMLECRQAGAQLTIRNTVFTGGRWRAIDAAGGLYFDITNCDFNHCWGVRIDNVQSGGHINFLRNANSNTQRYIEHPHFFQCANNPSSVNIEVAWNQSINVYGQSDSEDVINIYSSCNANVHDNGIRGAYPATLSTGYSGGGIIIDGPSGHDSNIHDNHVVDCMNYSVAIAGGYNNKVYNNRVVCDSKNDSGQAFTGQSSGGIGGYVADFSSTPSFTNNQFYNNVIGVLNGSGSRNDWWLPDCQGNCSGNTTLANPINKALEDTEWQTWLDKVVANGVTIGA